VVAEVKPIAVNAPIVKPSNDVRAVGPRMRASSTGISITRAPPAVISGPLRKMTLCD
jgi:hypothetical protein